MFSARTETGNGEREDRKNPLQNRKNAPFFFGETQCYTDIIKEY